MSAPFITTATRRWAGVFIYLQTALLAAEPTVGLTP